ncbi:MULTISPECIES: hypothetical protein [Bacillaceae]|uniref:Uncharacterized protein n=1 Tax=Evansella alkalicola TaxID=745819 RepID=A0ABS6K2G5_9BACI|nr:MULTISPECIES: hypothetical protein [Bacillaceae]MBU9724137.1 hypothetical protein [Bacillus alkalicola]
MNLYRVYNGYEAIVPIHIEVIASTEDRAEEIAKKMFKMEAVVSNLEEDIDEEIESDFWTDLEVEFVHEIRELDREFVSALIWE